MIFKETNQQHHRFWQPHQIIREVCTKNLKATLFIVDSSKVYDSIDRGKMEQVLLTYCLPKETVTAIIMLYKITKSMIRSSDGDRNLFDFVDGVLPWDIWTSCMFIICLDNELRTLIDLIKENGFTHKKYKKQTISNRNYNRHII